MFGKFKLDTPQSKLVNYAPDCRKEEDKSEKNLAVGCFRRDTVVIQECVGHWAREKYGRERVAVRRIL